MQSQAELQRYFLKALASKFEELGKQKEPHYEGQQYKFRGAAKEIQEYRDSEFIIAGAADTGKTLSALYLLNKLAWQYPNSRIVIARKQRSDIDSTALETFKNRILIKDSPNVSAYGGAKVQWYDYSNGSRIWIAGLDKESKLLSGEFDAIYVNQAEELSLSDWETLGTRANGRAGNMPFGLVFGDCNPASPTHWIRTRSKAGLLKLFESFHKDNPQLFDEDGQITEAGKSRIGVLKGLSGVRYKRLCLGMWVSPEGAIYENFDEEHHKIKAIEIPSIWPRAVGIDPLGAFSAAVWGAWDDKAKLLHIYREYYEPFGISTYGHAHNVLELSKNETIWMWVGGGPSENQQRVDWNAGGIPIIEPPFSEVWPGIDRVNNLLLNNGLVIHDSCPKLLSEIGEYRRKFINGQPTDIIDNKEQFHLLDALRYLIAGLTGPIDQTSIEYNPVRIARY